MKAHKGKPKRSDVSTLAVLRAVRAYGRERDRGRQYRPGGEYPPRPHERLCEELGCHPKVALRALEREVDRDRLSYGVSLSLPWLTPDGRLELSRLEQSS